MKGNQKDREHASSTYAGSGISIGAALGFIFGMLVFDNPVLGIGIGVAFGMILGAAIDARKKQARGSGDEK